MEKKNIYDLKLGEGAHIGPIELFRAPGGWIAFTIRGMCFVPWSNEFQEIKIPHPSVAEFVERLGEKPARNKEEI